MPRLPAACLLLLALSACGGMTSAEQDLGAEVLHERVLPEIEQPTESDPAPVAESPEPGNLYQGFAASVAEKPTLVARARNEVRVYLTPEDPDPHRTLSSTTILGTETVLAVIGPPQQGRIEVMLPGRPNGSTGWVEQSEVDLFPVSGRIVVDIGERTLTYYDGDEAVLEATVAVGSDRNPTPTGTFFVTDSVTLANPDSPWGPAALGLSARSETITEFNGGDGIIGIHGTNRPDTIGHAASLGCVRLPNELINELHELVALGTPVEIRA